jgi:carbon-monoxide dehydrogenase large subunit
MSKLSVVGKSVHRLDELEKVTGKAVFCADIMLPRMLYAKVLRSPYPHACVVSIETSKAERVPGVKCVATGRDAPNELYGMIIRDQPVLAKNVVRFVGEPVAAVAAESITAAEEAVDLIKVKYEPLPAVFDPEIAMSPDPPTVLHPDYLSYPRRDWFPGDSRFDTGLPNVYFHFKIRRGDVEKGFQEAYVVMESRFSTQKLQHAALEPHVMIVRPEADGGLTVHSARQSIWRLQAELSLVFGIKPSKIRIVGPYIGGSFGGKWSIGEEMLTTLLALKTSRPVKLVFTREEVFLRGGSRVPMVIYIKDGVKEDGTLISREMKCILSSGAYEHEIGAVTRNCAFGAVGTYNVPNFKFDSFGVYTNEPPSSAFRGFGSTQPVWAIESHMDMIAERLGMGAAEIRRKNLLKEGDSNATGEIVHSIGARKCLDSLVDYLKLDEKPHSEGNWRMGKGISLGSKFSAAPYSTAATVKLSKDASITVYHSADEMGQGCNTVAAQIAAEEFGISVDNVRVVSGDTLYCPFSPGSTSSRTTYFLGNAIRLTSQRLKKRLYELVAWRWGVSDEDLEVKGGEVYVRREPNKKMTISQAFARHRDKTGSLIQIDELVVSDTWIQDYTPEDAETGQIDATQANLGRRLTAFYTHTAKGVDVAVNTETGEVKVLLCASAIDMGQPVNPKMCEQQIEGGMVMGIGGALYEEMQMVDGKVLNPNFTDYKIPTTAVAPSGNKMVSILAPAHHKDGPFGAKGLGESTMVGMEPAIANAIYNAVGIRIKDLPITREKIWKELKKDPKKSERGRS